MYERSRENVKVEPRSTLPLIMRDTLYIASILFKCVRLTCART